MGKTKKKLLVTASTFPRWEGDTEPRFVLDLASHMTGEFDVTVLAPAAPGAKDREELCGVRVVRYHYFPIHKWENLCYPGAIFARIKEKKARILLVPFLFLSLWWHLLKMLPEFDLVHAHWMIPQGIVQAFFKKPYIVTGHGGDVASLNKGIFKKLKIRAIKKAKRVTVVSKYLQSKVQELVPECEPEIISMGVDLSKFGKQYFQKNYFGQGDKKVVLFVGRLVEVKGVTYLIEAMKTIDAILVIVGDGPLKGQLMQQAERQNNNVIFLGAKTHDELNTIYASADVFVMPSVTVGDGEREGFGLVLLEAMASGLPIVASESGGITDIVHNMQNGLLAREKSSEDLAEKITELLADKMLHDRIVKTALETVALYGYSEIAKKICKILNE